VSTTTVPTLSPDDIVREQRRRQKLREAAAKRPRAAKTGRFATISKMETVQPAPDYNAIYNELYIPARPAVPTPRPWPATAAWLLLGAALGVVGCVIVRGVW
jgi:hypothetical protein